MESQLDWRKALDHLGALVDEEPGESVHLVVAGGVALLYLGLVLRPTRDVDVIGLVEKHGAALSIHTLERADRKGVPFYRLPEVIERACRKTARDLGLSTDWINAVAADVVRTGLPEGAAQRLHTVRYGRRLEVSFLDRTDLIPLKLHAALDRGGGRHLEDLRRLSPTPDEIAHAAKWCLEQDSGLREVIRGALEAMGFSDGLVKLDP